MAGLAQIETVERPAAPPNTWRGGGFGAVPLQGDHLLSGAQRRFADRHPGTQTAGDAAHVQFTPPRQPLAQTGALVDPAEHPATDQLLASPPLPGLIAALGAALCQRHGLIPWQNLGAATVVATAHPAEFARLRPMLEARLGPVIMARAPAEDIDTALRLALGDKIAAQAETRPIASESCRSLGQPGQRGLLLAFLVMGFAFFWNAPLLLVKLALIMVLGVALLLVLATSLFKFLAAIAALRGPAAPPVAPDLALTSELLPGPLPPVSIIVALYRESDIAPRLVRRLSRLDYPHHLLEVILAVEADDTLTRAALSAADLPPWMRMVVVPKGRIKTKPRALNVALDHCHGAIIGIYDAEDAPEPNQIRRVVAAFQSHGPNVGCLQGVLDYYNPQTNWISRLFTIEYATWFRLILPGVIRLGLPAPLGGTSLFIRRSILERLGGWDAHNVTEDADLGLRLARHGFRTEMLASTTYEEANCRALPWVKQRSRWLKGFMMTWAVNMRSPVALWRALGPRGFWGVQIMMLGPPLQALLAPLLWSFWIMAFGFAHPLATMLPKIMLHAMIGLFVFAAALDFALAIIGLRRSGQKISRAWVFSLHLYYPMATFAAIKALWELIRRPFYWDKTSHGHFDKIAP